jgi:hypothetical protein
MAKKHDHPTACHNCKTVLQVRHHGSCPSCGTQPTIGDHGVRSERAFKHSLGSDTRRGFYETHKPIAVVMILIIFTFPIAGVFIKGVPGLLFGVVSSVLGYYLLPYAVHAVRRICGTD